MHLMAIQFPTSRDPAPDSRFSGAGGWGPLQPLR